MKGRWFYKLEIFFESLFKRLGWLLFFALVVCIIAAAVDYVADRILVRCIEMQREARQAEFEQMERRMG